MGQIEPHIVSLATKIRRQTKQVLNDRIASCKLPNASNYHRMGKYIKAFERVMDKQLADTVIDKHKIGKGKNAAIRWIAISPSKDSVAELWATVSIYTVFGDRNTFAHSFNHPIYIKTHAHGRIVGRADGDYKSMGFYADLFCLPLIVLYGICEDLFHGDDIFPLYKEYIVDRSDSFSIPTYVNGSLAENKLTGMVLGEMINNQFIINTWVDVTMLRRDQREYAKEFAKRLRAES